MTKLPDGIYLPRKNRFHFSDWMTWKQSKERYVKQFFNGRDDLNTKAIQFGSYVMHLMEFDQDHPLVVDIPRHPHVEYDLRCMLGGVIPIETHPDSIDIDNTLGLYEYKTALEHRAWNSRMVYKQQQISFYQMCVRELKNNYNPDENYIVEIPTQRKDFEEHDGVRWESTEAVKYREITRATLEDGSYMPVKLHRRVVTDIEMDKLKDDVITSALEVSDLYKKYLENELSKIT